MRFPNPIVPFAYLSLGKTYDSVTLPIYQPSPSISLVLYNTFKPYFANQEVKDYIKSILLGNVNLNAQKLIENKALELTAFLASKRKASDGILSANEWKELFKIQTSQDIASWLNSKAMSWRKKISIPITQTLSDLISAVSALNVSAVCSKEMPFCLLFDNSHIEMTLILYGKLRYVFRSHCFYISDHSCPCQYPVHHLSIFHILGFSQQV